MSKVIVSIPIDGGLIFLRGVNFQTSEVSINGNPTQLLRKEKFSVSEDGNMINTQSYFFSIKYLYQLCMENDCVDGDKLLNV